MSSHGPPSLPPRSPGAFVGRAVELSTLGATLGGGGAVWLSGMGGIGKSRLAAELCWRSGGAWVELEPVVSDGELGRAIGRAVAFPAEGQESPEALSAWLRARRRPLLVLDGADRLLEDVRRWFEALRGAAPLLVTARRAAGVAGDHPLGPLSVPDGAALFHARAPERAPLPPDPDRDAASVRGLVEALGGHPLAVELAAARLVVLDLSAIRAGVDRTLSVLRDPLGEGRRASVEATLQWSFDLLRPPERSWLECASAFAGPFRLADLAGLAGATEADALDAVQVLVTLRWLEPSAPDESGARWFAAHPLVRRFVGDGLAGGRRAALRLAHGRWFGRLAAELLDALFSPAYRRARDHVRRIGADLLRVLEAAEGGAPLVDEARAAVRLLGRWGDRRVEWLERAAALPAGDPVATGAILRELLHERTARGLPLDPALLEATRALGHGAFVDGEEAAARLWRDPTDRAAAAALRRAVESVPDAQRAALESLEEVLVHAAAGDLERVSQSRRRTLERVGPGEDRRRAEALERLARVEIQLGRRAEAAAHLREALDLADSEGTRIRARALFAALDWYEGRWTEAEAEHAALVRWHREVGDRANAAHYATSRALMRLQLGLDPTPARDGPERFEDLPGFWPAPRHSWRFADALIAIRAGRAPGPTDDLGPWGAVVDALARAADPAAPPDALESAEALLAPEVEPNDQPLRAAARGVLAQLRTRRDAWRVASDGSAFAAPRDGWVHLDHRPTLMRVLVALSDGEVHDLPDLGARVWPGERMVPKALRNRVYAAVSTLRKLGLDLETTGAGWRLAGPARVERPPGSSGGSG